MKKYPYSFRKIFTILLSIFVFIFLQTPLSAQTNRQIKKILVITSSEIDNMAYVAQVQGVKSKLAPEVQVNIQSMDCQTIIDDENYSQFYKRISNFTLNNDFDVFITSGDEALDFVKKYYDELFYNKPIVYMGVKNPVLVNEVETALQGNVFGIPDEIAVKENLDLAKVLFRGTKRFIFITDNSLAGKAGSESFKKARTFYNDVDFIELNTEQISPDEVKDFLENADDNSVVFFHSARGIPGNTEHDVNFILDCCKENKVPVLSCCFGNLHTGVLGGYYNSYELAGITIGESVNEILAGANISDLKFNNDLYHYFFDNLVMKKFGISKKQLPKDTSYINNKNYFNIWILSTAILAVLAGIILALDISHKKQILMLEELLKENRSMLHAIMDQSETVYWECDFNQEFVQEKETTIENLEELESVDDEMPLGKIEDADEAELVPISSVGDYSEKAISINTKDVVLGWIYSGVIQREYRDQFNQILKDFREGKTKRSIEIDMPLSIEDILNNVQTERWKHIVYRAIKTHGDKVVRAICSATDVTSQKRAEREYESIMKYQSFVQQNYPAYTRINLTKNIVLERLINLPDIGKLVKGNSAATELDFLRKLITSREENHMFANTLDREDLIIAFKNGARQKSCDFCYKFSNGVIHWFNLCMELAFNPSSGDIEAYCYLKDISNQTIADITKDSVLGECVEYIFWLNKVTGVCQFINKSETMDWISEKNSADYKTMLDTLIKKKVTDADKETVKKLFDISQIEEQLKTQKQVRFTFHTRKEDGSIEIKQEKVYYLEEGGNIIVFVGTDITAITLMESQQNEKLAQAIKEAERANYAKSEFLSRMSHDLRTPMNGIMGIAELASKELDNPQSLEQDLAKIKSSSSYMLGLLNDILDMSKIESGHLEISKERCSFGDILENLITLAHVMCDKNGIDFYCNRNPDNYRDFILNIDRLHVQQIAMNLVSNASKYTPSGGRIEFLLDSVPKGPNLIAVEVIIRDTGAGMSKDFQKIMYEAFTQDTNSVNKVGTGLGLAIVHNLIKLMGGTIDCVSAPGEGTEFTIKLDVEVLEDGRKIAKKDRVAIKKANPELDFANLSIKGKRALLVEDNELNQEIASRLLESEGLEVEVAGNGLEALNIFSEKPLNYFDIVFMDVMMPVMDGLQATHLMRGLDREDAKSVPIIAMTANAFKEDIERCIEAGMNTHVAKPIEVDKLILTVKKYIGE